MIPTPRLLLLLLLGSALTAGVALAPIMLWLAIAYLLAARTVFGRFKAHTVIGTLCACYTNAGNLGLPLCLFAFGPKGLGLAIGFYLVGSVSQFLVGPLFQGRKPVWRTLLSTPVNYAAVLGVALLSTGTALPAWLGNTVQLLAGMAIPLMLVALGHPLGSFSLNRLRVATALALARLGLGLAVGLGIVWSFGLEGTERGVVLIESAMPVAVFNYLLAARYDRHPEEIAGAIVFSTLLSFATLPLLLLVALPS